MPPCLHEDHVLVCPFCAGSVDADTLVCSTCREMVAAATVCAYCGDEIGEGSAASVDVIDHPRHVHTWIIDALYIDTPDTRERCTGCGAGRDQAPWEQREGETR